MLQIATSEIIEAQRTIPVLCHEHTSVFISRYYYVAKYLRLFSPRMRSVVGFVAYLSSSFLCCDDYYYWMTPNGQTFIGFTEKKNTDTDINWASVQLIRLLEIQYFFVIFHVFLMDGMIEGQIIFCPMQRRQYEEKDEDKWVMEQVFDRRRLSGIPRIVDFCSSLGLFHYYNTLYYIASIVQYILQTSKMISDDWNYSATSEKEYEVQSKAAREKEKKMKTINKWIAINIRLRIRSTYEYV